MQGLFKDVYAISLIAWKHYSLFGDSEMTMTSLDVEYYNDWEEGRTSTLPDLLLVAYNKRRKKWMNYNIYIF